MPLSPFVQKRLLSVMDTLVRAIINEICELDDVSVLKAGTGAQPPDRGGSVETVVRVTAALETLKKKTADQICHLFCPLSGRAQAKASLSFFKRQQLKRRWLAKTKNQVKPSLSGIQPATDSIQERGLGEEDISSQGDSVHGVTFELPCSSGDPTLYMSDGPPSHTVQADLAQESGLKVELDHEKEQVESSSPHHEQKEGAMYDQQESVLMAISKEENGSMPTYVLPTSSETLEIKISAAQSLERNVGAKENRGSRSQETPVRAETTSGSTQEGTTARNLIKCEACGKTFTYLNNLKRHQKTFHSRETPHACQDCGESFDSKQLLRIHLRAHRVEKPHACTLCAKAFRLPNHLKKHMTTHTNERPFTCTTCGKNFALVSTLKAHERTHSGEKTFICLRCGMSFLTKSYLDYHQRVHTGEKPFTCKHCGKTFAQKSNLRVHERLHTGEKPFHCEDCGESFIHANSYKSHRQLHTGLKAFCCEHCGKGFRRGTHLKTHLLTHSGVKPFQCDLCPKTFALKGSLKAHRLTHTGEKSFVCNICSKSFTQASSLGKHKRTHTGEKPYLCTFCNKSFCQSSHLHYHYRAFHPGAAIPD